MAKLLHPATLTALSLTVAMIFFLLGVLIGVICTKCTMRFQRASKPVAHRHHDHASVPIYEEVPLQTVVEKESINLECKIEDNVAYGSMH